MLGFKLFSLIFGFSVCVLVSASEHKEIIKQKATDPKLESKWNEKFEYLSERMEQMEVNQATGSSAIEQIKTDVAKLINMVDQVFIKLEDNSKKLEDSSKKIKKFEDHFSEKLNNNSKTVEDNSIKIGILIEKIDENLNNTADEVFGEFRSKCRSMCEVKGHGVANQTKAKLEHQLEQLESCLIEDNQKACNLCSPNPCNGGRCEVNPTGNGYNCTQCPNATYGTLCQKSKCDRDNRCFQYKSTMYFVFETLLNWEEANRNCASEGLTLAMPWDQKTSEFLMSQLRPIYGYEAVQKYIHFWFGLKADENGMQWRWIDGSPLGEYTGGWSGFRSYTDLRCGILYLHGGSSMWNPYTCTIRLFSLCEKRV